MPNSECAGPARVPTPYEVPVAVSRSRIGAEVRERSCRSPGRSKAAGGGRVEPPGDGHTPRDGVVAARGSAAKSQATASLVARTLSSIPSTRSISMRPIIVQCSSIAGPPRRAPGTVGLRQLCRVSVQTLNHAVEPDSCVSAPADLLSVDLRLDPECRRCYHAPGHRSGVQGSAGPLIAPPPKPADSSRPRSASGTPHRTGARPDGLASQVDVEPAAPIRPWGISDTTKRSLPFGPRCRWSTYCTSTWARSPTRFVNSFRNRVSSRA